MTSKELFSEIHSYCVAHANEANVIKYSRYFKGGYSAYGLSQTQMNDKIKTLAKDPRNSLPLVIEMAPLLFESGKYEEISFALLLFNAFSTQYKMEDFKVLETWFQISIQNWAHADTLGMWIVPAFLKKRIISLDNLSLWKASEFKFQRRTVPVSLISVVKTTSDYRPLFDFIDSMMMDTEREVHQGLGWFLREAWKRQPALTEEFLYKWKDSAARLIFQYATEKMTPEGKNKFRRVKSL